tara:strand:- start:1740 stop:2666 length:927 start_codon:yes stop_codon:yes gene_type:complete
MKISKHGCKLVLFVTYGYLWKCAKCLQRNVTSEIKWDIPKPLSGLYTFPNEHAPDMPRYAMKIFNDSTSSRSGNYKRTIDVETSGFQDAEGKGVFDTKWFPSSRKLNSILKIENTRIGRERIRKLIKRECRDLEAEQELEAINRFSMKKLKELYSQCLFRRLIVDVGSLEDILGAEFDVSAYFVELKLFGCDVVYLYKNLSYLPKCVTFRVKRKLPNNLVVAYGTEGYPVRFHKYQLDVNADSSYNFSRNISDAWDYKMKLDTTIFVKSDLEEQNQMLDRLSNSPTLDHWSRLGSIDLQSVVANSLYV